MFQWMSHLQTSSLNIGGRVCPGICPYFQKVYLKITVTKRKNGFIFNILTKSSKEGVFVFHTLNTPPNGHTKKVKQNE